MTSARTCYGCAGAGRRGVFECGVCGGAGKLTGPPVQAHADSFRRGALRLPGPDRPRVPESAPIIRTRCRRRLQAPESDG